MRRLPLADKYSASFSIFPVQSGAFVECRINVQNLETVTVPAGTFDCYRLDLVLYSANTKALQHTLWFSVDDQKYLVKYDSKQAILELEQVTQMPKEDIVQFDDKNLGISISTPADWYLFESSTFGRYSLYVQMLPPGLKAWASFVVDDRPTTVKSIQRVAEKDLELLKGIFKNYIARPATWRAIKIGSLPASSFIADYDDKDKEMVEYRAYILGQFHVYWFVFRAEKEKFEENKPEFDTIIQSFTLT